MTTVKAMSNAGRLADVPTDSYRTSRAAGENIIPAETNTAEILDAGPPPVGRQARRGGALNVPVVDGSTVDLTTDDRPCDTTVEEVNAVVAAGGRGQVPRDHRVRGRSDRLLGRADSTHIPGCSTAWRPW